MDKDFPLFDNFEIVDKELMEYFNLEFQDKNSIPINNPNNESVYNNNFMNNNTYRIDNYQQFSQNKNDNQLNHPNVNNSSNNWNSSTSGQFKSESSNPFSYNSTLENNPVFNTHYTELDSNYSSGITNNYESYHNHHQYNNFEESILGYDQMYNYSPLNTFGLLNNNILINNNNNPPPINTPLNSNKTKLLTYNSININTIPSNSNDKKIINKTLLPNKNMESAKNTSNNNTNNTNENSSTLPVKRKRGRPRKNPEDSKKLDKYITTERKYNVRNNKEMRMMTNPNNLEIVDYNMFLGRLKDKRGEQIAHSICYQRLSRVLKDHSEFFWVEKDEKDEYYLVYEPELVKEKFKEWEGISLVHFERKLRGNKKFKELALVTIKTTHPNRNLERKRAKIWALKNIESEINVI
eukprot:TRINITY_DN3898_c0_g1_i1.p1 TRINITY_DN3898_c0_g1~~TRINITY_DN3898_c0_g1_i1.p1  ORF type:complete len:409 (+),score=77.27 TRINITY_DN3898_c0_g1_i1:49-1275(+)